MIPEKFNGKVAWVTGASSGIGAALAISLSHLGAILIITARHVANLEKVWVAFTFS